MRIAFVSEKQTFRIRKKGCRKYDNLEKLTIEGEGKI